MGRLIDLTGQRFGRLTVIEKDVPHITKGGKNVAYWRCKCDCGVVTSVNTQKLRNGHTTSCGCAKHDIKGSFEDLTGKRFHRLVVIRYLDKSERTTRGYNWLCKCDCGNTVKANAYKLKDGSQKSCGCLKEEMKPILGRMTRKYKYSNKRLYSVYKSMLSRVYDESAREYKNYGGRGITVCDEWLGLNGYDTFAEWAYSAGYDDNAKHGICTLDRKDVDGGYSPSNCRWVTNDEQQNNRRDNVLLDYRGETHNMKEWSKILNIPYTTIGYHCRKKDRSIEEMLQIYKK